MWSPCRLVRPRVVEEREKEPMQVKHTNNILFPEARKIVQNSNKFPTKPYSEADKQNIETNPSQPCQSCHSILEKLASITLDNLPKFIQELKSSLPQPESKHNQKNRKHHLHLHQNNRNILM